MGLFSKKKVAVGGPTNVQGNYATGNAKFQEIKRAYDSCLAHGGVPIMPFAQGLPYVRGAWKQEYVGTGICQALVNYWLADHASGSSLWTRLYDGGKFQPEAILDIGRQQGLFGQPDGLGTSGKILQKLRSEAWLERRGLRMITQQPYTGGDRGDLRGWRIGYDIANKGMANKPGGCYRMISFTSGTISHVVCAWVQRDVAFFDPNYGEFWFESREKFVPWFQTFWDTDTYDNFDGFEIRDLAEKVGA
jgi:hypothetical protein